jgi:glycosyltransferase involved in cell wall biosynthesis
MPTFSVITVCYNEAANIKSTLDSVISQTSHDYEWIVIDGGSTDGTKEILQQYASHFAWWCSEPDKGIYNAMNKGVAHATGHYVIFMNGGDCFHDERVLEEVAMSGITADVIEGKTVAKGSGVAIQGYESDIVQKLLTDGICHQSTFAHRELLQKYPFDENYKIAADWKFWLQCILRDKCSYQYLDRTISAIDTNGVTYTNFQRNLQERDLILAEFESDTVLSPLARTLRDYNYLTHNTLVQYAVWLDKNSPRRYQIARKIVKRLVKWL